jgi:hypothetical protein
MSNNLVVKKVIFHPPATIVYWGDGTKTVVKCMKGDTFNPELGMAMCMLKRMLDPPSYARYKKHTQEYVNRYLEKRWMNLADSISEDDSSAKKIKSVKMVDSNLTNTTANSLTTLIDLLKGTIEIEDFGTSLKG